jgi:hypothetical protein
LNKKGFISARRTFSQRTSLLKAFPAAMAEHTRYEETCLKPGTRGLADFNLTNSTAAKPSATKALG